MFSYRSGKAVSFVSGRVKGKLNDTVFIRNVHCTDSLDLTSSLSGYLKELYTDEVTGSFKARVITFFRPVTLPPHNNELGVKLDQNFELIFNETGEPQSVVVDVEDIIYTCKIIFCPCLGHIPEKTSEYPFFCRLALTVQNGKNVLEKARVFKLVTENIAIQDCNCKPKVLEDLEHSISKLMENLDTSRILTENQQNSSTPESQLTDKRHRRNSVRIQSQTQSKSHPSSAIKEQDFKCPQGFQHSGKGCDCEENYPPRDKKRRKTLNFKSNDGSSVINHTLCSENKSFVNEEDKHSGQETVESLEQLHSSSDQKQQPFKRNKEVKNEMTQLYHGIQDSQEKSSPPLSINSMELRSNRSLRKRHIDTPRPVSKKISIVVNSEPIDSPAKSQRNDSSNKISRVRRKFSLCTPPSMPERTHALKVSESSLETARSKLHVSAVPTALPCRETEFQNIYQFLEDKIYDACGGCMYISGLPGTGKTATVHAVIRCLQGKMETKQLPEFEFVEVNGLRLTEPRQVYVQMLQQLTGQKCGPQQARDILSKRFDSKAKSSKSVVLLVDEVDMVLNSRQDVVYNLFEWPNRAYSRLVVLTIANTMDLPERLFMGRVTSRLGLTRLTFQAYSFKQLQEIVLSRLDGTSSFNADAIQLVARKVAAISGDARRALDICRHATELVKESDVVSVKTIELAFNQMLNTPNVKALRACSKFEKLFLKAIVAEKERTGIEETNFIPVYNHFKALCVMECGKTPHVTEALTVLSRLGSSRLILTEHSRSALHQSVYLNVCSDDIHYALNVTESNPPSA